MAESNIEQFRKLIKEYHRISKHQDREHEERTERFLALCTHGRELITQRLESLALVTQRWRDRFTPQIPTFDLFEALGIAGKENRYTDMIAWLCRRTGGRGEAFARDLLSRLHPAHLRPALQGTLQSVEREMVTDDGRVDLVLEFEQAAIALEVKVWSAEHATPGASPQTISYPEALKRKIALTGRPKPELILMVLLSPEGTPPLSEEAARLSFFDLADSTLATLAPTDTDEERAVVRLFAAHVLDTASQSVTGRSFRDIHRELNQPREQWPTWLIQEASILARLTTVMEADIS
jgi:hypothetical protein